MSKRRASNADGAEIGAVVDSPDGTHPGGSSGVDLETIRRRDTISLPP
ncbi:MAG: hypothetical protein WBZ24_06920 [Anaerolineales bacterium]